MTALAALAVAAPAAAQDAAATCDDPALREARCATFAVPLDHDAASSPSIALAYARFPATGTRRGTLVYLAGGPGDAAIPAAAVIVETELRALRRSFDVVFVDQRGTGASSPLGCATAPDGVLDVDPDAPVSEITAAIARCGADLGAARGLYTTHQTVGDLEALRVHLGVPRIIPLGVSYGGSVAGEYARRFPERTQALILDSSSPGDGVDALAELPHLALPRVLREVCFPPACEELHGAPAEILAAAVERIGDGALRGRIVLPTGERRRASIDVTDLYALLRQSDTDPALRTALPAALEAAARGDAGPLLRQALRGAEGVPAALPSTINEVRFLATACAEGRLPWDPASDPATRQALLDQALAAGAARYAPFSAETVATQLTATLCTGWPPTARPPQTPRGAVVGSVPTLILAGREDLRTPLEDQRRLAARFPGSVLVAVPNVGHSVLSSDLSGCARSAVRAFLLAVRREPCRSRPRPVPLALPAYARLSAVPDAGGRAPRLVEDTIVAVDLTLRDAVRELRVSAFGPTSGAGTATVRVGGLRGGRLIIGARGLRLRAYEHIPGVRVGGAIGADGAGTLTVTGRGATGTLRRRASGTLVGRLDGTRIRYRPRDFG